MWFGTMVRKYSLDYDERMLDEDRCFVPDGTRSLEKTTPALKTLGYFQAEGC